MAARADRTVASPARSVELPSEGVQLAILVAAALLAFLASLRFDFVYDDNWTIVENAFVKHLGNLSRFFGAEYFQGVPDNNRPLMIVSTMIDYQLYGLRPWGYHLQNVLWHVMATVLVWRLYGRLFDRPLLALFAALLFAVHPIHAEVVATINYREDLLSTVFSLATLLLILRYRESGRRTEFVGALVAFLLAIFSKETAFVVPLLLVASDFTLAPDGERWATAWRNRRQVAGLLAVGAATFGPFALAFRGAYTSVPNQQTIALVERVWTTFRINALYLAQLAVPLGLSPEYDVQASGVGDPANWLGLMVCVVLVVAAVLLRKRTPAVTWGVAWLAIAHLPTMNLIPIFNMRADRYMYFPSIGACAALAAALLWLGERLGERTTGGARPRSLLARREIWPVAAVVVLFLPLCVRQSLVYATQNELWARGVAAAPDSQRAWEGAVMTFAAQGEPQRALELATQGLARFPNAAKILVGRGMARAELGDLDGALADFEAAVPSLEGVERGRLLNNIGVAYARKGDYRRAEQAYRDAIAVMPEDEMFRRNLAEVLEAQGRVPDAIAEYEAALRISPRDQTSAAKLADLRARAARR